MMIELGLYLVIAALLFATVKLPEMIREIENNNANSTGEYATEVRTAVNRYVAGNQAQIVAGNVPGFVNPLAPTIAELINTQYLPTGFPTRTALGPAMRITLSKTNCPGTNCQIGGTGFTIQAVADETGAPRIPLLATAASKIGVDGMLSFPAAPSMMTGIGGATAANPVAGTPAGILGIRVGYGSAGYQDIIASGINGPCLTITSTTGIISVKCNGNITVTDGTNTTTMNAAGFSAPTGTLQSQTLSTTGDNYFNGTSTQGTACTTTGSIRTNTKAAGLVICDGTKWQPIGTAISNITNGTACSITGQLATGSDNSGYICRGGVYVSLNTAFGSIATTRKVNNVTDGMTFAKDACPGGTPWALYTPAILLVNVTGYVLPPIQGAYFMANDGGSYWSAQASGRSPAGWYSGNDTWNLGGQLVGTMTMGCAY